MMAGSNGKRTIAAMIVVAVAACGRDKAAPKAVAHGPVVDSTAPGRAATTNGFKTPESVRYDSVNDVFYVSNINGSPLAKDNNGFISRMKPDGKIDSLELIAGGRDGVTLNAPKGLVLIGDTLWATDIDVVRGFNVRTGAAVATVDFAPFHALFLNDICVGGDGALYVTDMGVKASGDSMAHVAGSGSSASTRRTRQRSRWRPIRSIGPTASHGINRETASSSCRTAKCRRYSRGAPARRSP